MKNRIDIKTIILDRFFERRLSEKEIKKSRRVNEAYEKLYGTLNDQQRKLLIEYDKKYSLLKVDEAELLAGFIFDFLHSIWR